MALVIKQYFMAAVNFIGYGQEAWSAQVAQFKTFEQQEEVGSVEKFEINLQLTIKKY